MADRPRLLILMNGFHRSGGLWDKAGGDLGRGYELGNSEDFGRLYEPVDVEIPGRLYRPFDTEFAEPSRPKKVSINRFVDGVTFAVPAFVQMSAGLVEFA